MTYKTEFIQLCLHHDVIRFGEFTLKSGRVSPYFFNAGKFQTGQALAKLGRYYAEAIQASSFNYDILFGPAYKGIPLVSTTAVALAEQFNLDKPYCFNRKEAKDHGEGGQLVGAPMSGRVLIIDDVITAGTAIRESLALIQACKATLAGVLVLFDRAERGQGEQSAVQEIADKYQAPVMSVIDIMDLMQYMKQDTQFSQQVAAIEQYHSQFGVC